MQGLLNWRETLNFLKRAIRKLKIKFLTVLNRKRFYDAVSNQFSSNLINLIEYSYHLNLSKMDFDLANKIENLRSQTREALMTFTSPKSGRV